MPNYLLHALTGGGDPLDRIANIQGDFIKGQKITLLSAQQQAGIKQHQLIDRYTDQHPLVIELKSLFPSPYRRFASISLDVLFDHFLAKHWGLFHTDSLTTFSQQTYFAFAIYWQRMPAKMQYVATMMSRQNWLENYASLDFTSDILDRMSRRIRFENSFLGVVSAIDADLPRIEQAFFDYMQALDEQFDLQLKQKLNPR